MRKPREIRSFSIQFISNLVEEALLVFDYTRGRWQWNLGKIRSKGHSDNVVDLMVEKLKRLPAETRFALQQLACIGNSADFDTLAIVSGNYRRRNACRPMGRFAARVGLAA